MSFSLNEYAQSKKRKERESDPSKKFSLREYAEAKKNASDGAQNSVVLQALRAEREATVPIKFADGKVRNVPQSSLSKIRKETVLPSPQRVMRDFAFAKDFTENYGARAAAASMPEVSERDRRDAAVRNNYAERLQAEQDARYAGYNVAEAEARLNNPGYWMQKIRENRSAGNGFEGDTVILAERDALEKEVAEARAAQERNRVRSFARIPQNNDFEELSEGGFYGNYDPRMANPAKYGEMTDEEVKVWRYLQNSKGKNGQLPSAEEYLQSLEDELTQRRGVKMGVKARTIDNPIGRGAAALGLAALSGIKSPIEGTGSALTGEGTEQGVLDYAAGYVRNDIDGALGVAYDLTQSTANMVPSILLSSLTGVPALGTASMGVSAAGNAYSDALRDGYSKGQAALYGGIVGASEAALQNILGGIGALGGKMSATSVLKKLVEKIPRAGLRAAVKLAGSGFSEATEEGLQTYIEAGLRKVIFDENFNLRDVSEDALYSAMLGALSAGLLEGPGVVVSEMENGAASRMQNAKGKVQNEGDTSAKPQDDAGIDERSAEAVQNDTEAAQNDGGNVIQYTAEEADGIRKDSQTFRNVIEGIDITLSEFFSKWKFGRKNGEKLEKLYLGKASERVKKKISDLLGYEISNRDFIITNDAVKHVFDEHGNIQTEEVRGQIAVNEETISEIREALNNPDSITKEFRKKEPRIVFEKKTSAGDVIVVEADNKGRATLSLKTFYIKKGQESTQRGSFPDNTRANLLTSETTVPNSSDSTNIPQTPKKSNRQNMVEGDPSAEPQDDTRGTARYDAEAQRGKVVRDDNYKRAKLTSREGRVLDALARITGTRIRFTETINKGKANAEYANGEITIALDSEDPVRVAVVHEVIHRLKEISSDNYRKLSDFVFNNLSEEENLLLWKDFGMDHKELSPDKISEEIVAQAFGVVMGDKNRIDALIRDDRGTWEKICDIINDLIISIRRAISGERAAQISENDRAAFSGLLAKAEEMEKVLREALDASQLKVENGKLKVEAQNDAGADAKAEKNTAGAEKSSVKTGTDGNAVYNIGQMQERSFPGVDGSSAVNSGAQVETSITNGDQDSGSSVNNDGALSGKTSFDNSISETEGNVNTKSSRKRNEEERGRIYELERENKKQKKLIEQMRERMRGLDKKVIRGAVDRKEARRATREIIRRYGGEINPRELAPELQELWDGIGTGKNLNWEDIHAKAKDIAQRIAESSIERDDTKYRDFADLRKFCRENTFTISESDRSNIPDFNDFRKRNMGRIRIAYGKTDIDTQYRILSDMFPELFDEEAISHPADQLLHIAEVLGDVYDIKERSRFDSNMDYAVGTIANDILETFYELPETKKTLKDLKIEKLTRTVAEKTNSERNAVKELEKYKKTAEREAEELQKAYNKARLESAREKEKLRENKEKFYDEKRKQETRGKIIRGIDRLSRLAMRPSDKSHIPEGLRGAVKGFLGCINLSSEWAIDANTGHVVKRLPADMERRELLPIKREVRYEELRAMFLDAEEEFAIPSEFLRSDVDTPYLLEVSELSNKSVYEMDIDELNKVWRTVQIVEAAIRNGNRAFAFKSYEGIEELAEAVKRDNEFTAERINLGKLEGVVRLVKTGMMKPITFFHMMGKTGDEIFFRLAEAEKAKDRRIREMKKKTAEIRRGLDIYALEKEGHDVTLGGQRVRLSTAQIMELYALSRRKQGLSHILNGGIKPQAFLERGKSLKEAETVKDRVGAVMGKTYTKAIEDITVEEIGKAVALLSDEQKKAAEGLQRYLSTDVSEMMNNACLQVFGYKKFLEKVYWPIRTDPTERGAEEGKARKKNTTPAISSLGMTKATTPQGAGTPILLGSVFDTFSRHCEEAASYAEKLAVTEDIRRLRRHRYASAGKTEAKTFAQVVEGIFGRAGNEYWDRLDENIASGTDRTGNADNPFSGATTANKAAAVSLNMRVWMQQVFSVLRAMGRINPLYIPGGVYRPIHGWKKALKYSEVARKKGSGFSDVNTGPAMKSILFEQKTFSEKIRDWGMAPAGWMDSVGWGILWNACELEVKADMEKEAKGKRTDSGLAGVKAGSELFYEIVCERFEREIYRSQVFDGILQRSHIMRSGNELVNMATSFMSETTTAVNDVYIAAIDVARAETSKEKRSAGRAFARVLTAELVQIVAVAALGQGFWDAIRDDDKEKSYWEKWFEHTKDNIADQLNPLGYFPFLKDAVSVFSGYEASRMDMANFAETATVITNFAKVINGESKYTLAEVSAQAFAAAGSFLGIGTRNLKRDVQAVLRSIAVESGNFLFEYRLEKGMLNMNYKDNGKTFYDILYRAYEKDSDAYEIIYADMIKNGMEEKKIMAAMEDRMKKRAGVKEVSELEARYLPPEKQKKYSETLSPVKSTEVWKTASPAQRKELEEDVYNLTALNDDGEKLRDKMNEAAKYGIDTTQYLLYLLACDVVDKQNKSGKLGGAPTSKEFKEAALLAGLSKKERDYLWEQLHPGE